MSSSSNDNLHILNLESKDLFAAAADDHDDTVVTHNYIHIRLQQRNGRQTLTTIQGLQTKLDLRKLLREFKKTFCCNGTIVSDPLLGQIVQLQGDQRKNTVDLLVNENISSRSNIKVHGF